MFSNYTYPLGLIIVPIKYRKGKHCPSIFLITLHRKWQTDKLIHIEQYACLTDAVNKCVSGSSK